MEPRILMIDDEQATCRSFTRYLHNAGYAVDATHCMAAARQALNADAYDAVLLDLQLPDGNGLEWIPTLRGQYPDMAIVVITGNGAVESAVEAMRLGADNYLTKPVDLKKLDVSLQKSLELEKLRRTSSIQKRLERKDRPYFGHTPRVETMLEHALLAAKKDTVVLLQGETGTGKGVLARWIHEHSLRKKEAFVEVNCSMLKGDLLNSELFGHTKGAFTSAIRDREGLIGVADGGTLFLDEIGDMDLGVQAQFLKAIEERTYRRVGETKLRHSDFRLICATHRNLESEAREGRFREDLFYRLNVFPLTLPSLREVRQIIPGLAAHLLAGLGAPDKELRDEVAALLTAYRWPGNVRELRNMLERAVLLCGDGTFRPEHFPGLDGRHLDGRYPQDTLDLDQNEERCLVLALDKHPGDTLAAARELGISRAALYRKLQKHGLGKYAVSMES